MCGKSYIVSYMTDNIQKGYKIGRADGRNFVTIPSVLMSSLGLRTGDTVTWRIDRGELILRKI